MTPSTPFQMGFLQSSNSMVLQTGPYLGQSYPTSPSWLLMAVGAGVGSAPQCSHPHHRIRSLSRNTSCKQSFPHPSKIPQLLPSLPPPRKPARRSIYSGRGLIPAIARISPSVAWEWGWRGERKCMSGSSPKAKGLL